MFLPKLLFEHISYVYFQIQTSSGKVLHNGNFLYTDFKKLEGTLDMAAENDSVMLGKIVGAYVLQSISSID